MSSPFRASTLECGTAPLSLPVRQIDNTNAYGKV